MARFIGFFIIASIFVSQCKSARILGLFTAPSKSHIIVHTSVADALVEQGHDVTVVTTAPVFKKTKNYRHIKLDVTGLAADYHTNLISDSSPKYQKFARLVEQVTSTANASLHMPEFKQLMENESFDLVILGYFFNEFQLGVAAHFKCPVVVSFMNQPMAFVNKMVGNPEELAYVPNVMLGGKQPLSFRERVAGWIAGQVSENIMVPLTMDGKQQAFYE